MINEKATDLALGQDSEICMEQRKESGLLNKVWEVLKPLVIYYVTFNIVFLLIAYLCNAAMEYLGIGVQEYLTEHATTVTELVNGLSMLISVLPLIPMLGQELADHKVSAGNRALRKADSSRNAEQRLQTMSIAMRGSGRVFAVVITVILAASSSIGLNILLTLTGFVQTSAAYQDVAKQQYSVMFGVGAILFGLISPITEEIVFRGLVFNRMRRYYPTAAAIIVSGLLFGAYHGNLVQGLYGTCMGILLAYTYERMRSFLIPCLFHAVANLMVYTLAQNVALHTRLFTTSGCIVLLVVSVVCILVIEKNQKCN